MKMREFTEVEKEILKRVQGSIPDCATPFAAIAAEVGAAAGETVAESQVLELLRELKEQGAIRRFGATLRHQKAGYGANAMVAWQPEDGADLAGLGRKMAANPNVSHCYHRRTYPEWPYSLYTMIHGRSPEECQETIGTLSRELGLQTYSVLYSIKELKKISMTYF